MTAKEYWFKKKRKKEEYASHNLGGPTKKQKTEHPSMTIMFMDRTWADELAAKLRQAKKTMFDKRGYHMKIVERVGGTIKNHLVINNPWEGSLYPDINNCQAHKSEEVNSCQTRSITYTNNY